MNRGSEKRITDGQNLASTAYKNAALIEKRQALYQFTTPRY